MSELIMEDWKLKARTVVNSVDQNVILLEYYDNYFSWFWKLSEKYTDSK